MQPASTTHGANVVSITTARGYKAPERVWLLGTLADLKALNDAGCHFEAHGPTKSGGFLFRETATA